MEYSIGIDSSSISTLSPLPIQSTAPSSTKAITNLSSFITSSLSNVMPINDVNCPSATMPTSSSMHNTPCSSIPSIPSLGDVGGDFSGAASEGVPTGGVGETLIRLLLPTTEATLCLLKRHFETYRQYVKQNPIWISEIESALYWISYLLSTTRFHNSRIVSELLYSCSSLLTLFNDTLLRKAYTINRTNNTTVEWLQLALQFIEYLQVFLELAALQLYGRTGKWIVISIIELVKAVLRLFLLLYFEQGLSRRQYFTPLNRAREFEQYQIRLEQPQEQQKKKHDEKTKTNEKSKSKKVSFDEQVTSSSVKLKTTEQPSISTLPTSMHDDVDHHHQHQTPEKLVDQFEVDQVSFRLKSSGRVIRNLQMAPPKSKRLWITPQQAQRLRVLLQKHNRHNPAITKLNRRRIIGEMLHIVRPLLHLATGAFTTKGLDHSWTPYILSLGIDLASLRLLQGSSRIIGADNPLMMITKKRQKNSNSNSTNDCNNDVTNDNDSVEDDPVQEVWNWAEQIEIQKRYLSLFMYLLRSPFYDRYTKERLLRLLSMFANHIPLFGRLLRPFITYLPDWQRIYFNTWSQF